MTAGAGLIPFRDSCEARSKTCGAWPCSRPSGSPRWGRPRLRPWSSSPPVSLPRSGGRPRPSPSHRRGIEGVRLGARDRGPGRSRLAGSPATARRGGAALSILKAQGFASVRAGPVTVPVWQRGIEVGEVVSPVSPEAFADRARRQRADAGGRPRGGDRARLDARGAEETRRLPRPGSSSSTAAWRAGRTAPATAAPCPPARMAPRARRARRGRSPHPLRQDRSQPASHREPHVRGSARIPRRRSRFPTPSFDAPSPPRRPCECASRLTCGKKPDAPSATSWARSSAARSPTRSCSSGRTSIPGTSAQEPSTTARAAASRSRRRGRSLRCRRTRGARSAWSSLPTRKTASPAARPTRRRTPRSSRATSPRSRRTWETGRRSASRGTPARRRRRCQGDRGPHQRARRRPAQEREVRRRRHQPLSRRGCPSLGLLLDPRPASTRHSASDTLDKIDPAALDRSTASRSRPTCWPRRPRRWGGSPRPGARAE